VGFIARVGASARRRVGAAARRIFVTSVCSRGAVRLLVAEQWYRAVALLANHP